MDLEKLYYDYFSVVYKYILSISQDPLTAEEEYIAKNQDKLEALKKDSILVWERE